MSDIDPGILRDLLSYDAESGKLFWLPRQESMFNPAYHFTAAQRAAQWNSRFAGKEALTNQGARGQKLGKIICRSYYAHRVAWAIHHGSWPNGEIDHINGDPSDNRIANLRDVTRSINMRNRPAFKKSKTGHPGIAWRDRFSAYQVRICVDNREIHLGYFKSLDEAIEVRKRAERIHNFHENHGRKVS